MFQIDGFRLLTNRDRKNINQDSWLDLFIRQSADKNKL